jgi:hypothetical protein
MHAVFYLLCVCTCTQRRMLHRHCQVYKNAYKYVVCYNRKLRLFCTRGSCRSNPHKLALHACIDQSIGQVELALSSVVIETDETSRYAQLRALTP